MSATMTVLQKPDGGVRGIATALHSVVLWPERWHANLGRQLKRHAPLSSCPLHAGGHRLRGSCNQGTHGCKPVDDNLAN